MAAVREGNAQKLEGDFPDEVMPLVAETNALLEAQETSLAIGAARAPAISRTASIRHWQSCPRKPARYDGKAKRMSPDEIDRQVEPCAGMSIAKLARARARGAQSRTGQAPSDVAKLLRELISAIESLPRGSELDWTVDVPETLMLGVDADDFNNMTRKPRRECSEVGEVTRKIHCGAIDGASAVIVDRGRWSRRIRRSD